MYLLLFDNVNKQQMEWLIKNALPVAPLTWIHNATVKGTIPVQIGSTAYRSLSKEINNATSIYLGYVEEKIKKNALRGVSKKLAINKLRVIVEVCIDMELIAYAKDLLYILGEEEEYKSTPETIKKETELGLDKNSVEDYLLTLSKKPTIH